MWRDSAYLLDMLVNARRVLRYMSGADRERLERDDVLQDAVVRRLQIIGEAARKVSPETRQTHPEIPWERVIGMRHRLVHDYRRVNLDVVWEVAQESIPELVRLLEPIVPPEEEV